jgi:hypothetical protein
MYLLLNNKIIGIIQGEVISNCWELIISAIVGMTEP